MIELGYWWRAAVLGFAVFFVANFFASAFSSLLSRLLRLEHLEAKHSARLLLALRLAPSVAGLALTGVALGPGFLVLERQTGPEAVSAWSLILAAAGLLGWLESLARTARAMLAARRWTADTVLETQELFVAVAGLWRPRIVASRGFLETVPEPQRSIALRHELAHFESWDNPKRLLSLLAPSMIPLAAVGSRSLDGAWMRYAERAADDAAVAGDPHRAALLAEVLVMTARSSGRFEHAPALASTLIGACGELSARVERLLLIGDHAMPPLAAQWPRRLAVIALAAPMLVAIALPARPFFEMLERLLLHAW